MTCALQDLAEDGNWGLIYIFLFAVPVWSNPRHFNSSVILYTFLVVFFLWPDIFA